MVISSLSSWKIEVGQCKLKLMVFKVLFYPGNNYVYINTIPCWATYAYTTSYNYVYETETKFWTHVDDASRRCALIVPIFYIVTRNLCSIKILDKKSFQKVQFELVDIRYLLYRGFVTKLHFVPNLRWKFTVRLKRKFRVK